MAITLGGAFGAILSKTVVPSLIFTNVPASGALSNVSIGEFYTLQQVVPPQVVIPSSLGILLPVSLAIFGIVVVMMMWLALQPSMGRMLRLNED